MNAKNLIDAANSLLKAAKDDPAKFESALKKDDAPHAPNTPQDKAHDVAEGDDSIQHAMKILDTPEKRSAMLEHLRMLAQADQQRSPENQEAGMTPEEKAAQGKPMDKAEMLSAAQTLIKMAKDDPAKFAELQKAMAAPKPPAPAAPAAPKAPPPAPTAAPKKPAMAKCGPMSKDEIKADLKTDWKPRFRKG